MSAPFVKGETISNSRQLCSSFLYRQIEHTSGAQNLLDEFTARVLLMKAEDGNCDLFTIGGFSIRRGGFITCSFLILSNIL